MKINTIQVGALFHNNNGQIYTIVYINKRLDRTLLVSEFGQYIGAFGISEKGWWEQGHYFMDNFKAALDYVLKENI